MKLISAETREDVWIKAVRYLQNDARDLREYNLILEVEHPRKSNSRSKYIRKKLDVLLAQGDKPPVQTVADTIFPAHEYKKYGINGLFEKYPDEIYPKIKSANGNTRGTYAYRLVRGFNQKGEEVNPLDKVIKRLKSQLKTQKIRCAFELSLDDVDTIPINRNDNFTRGFPCLSHLSFKLSHDRKQLHLTAIYRSQDYIVKALGNLLGLARLQDCVAKEIGIAVGTLVCHSTMATLDRPKGIYKKHIEALITDVEELESESTGIPS